MAAAGDIGEAAVGGVAVAAEPVFAAVDAVVVLVGLLVVGLLTATARC